MPVESWMMLDDVPGLAAQATDRIDGVLARLGEDERTAFWASVRKCYNTPYNDPKPRALPTLRVPSPEPPLQTTAGSERSVPGHDVPPAGIPLAAIPLPAIPLVAIPGAGFGVEAHAS